MDQGAPHDSLLMDVLMDDTVVVIVFMMITVSITTREASKTILLIPPEPSGQREVTPLGSSVI